MSKKMQGKIIGNTWKDQNIKKKYNQRKIWNIFSCHNIKILNKNIKVEGLPSTNRTK